jgi:hypothetical protein
VLLLGKNGTESREIISSHGRQRGVPTLWIDPVQEKWPYPSCEVERFNNILCQRVSRLVRDTLSFSKKLAHHIGAIKYFICHYNLTRAAALPV